MNKQICQVHVLIQNELEIVGTQKVAKTKAIKNSCLPGLFANFLRPNFVMNASRNFGLSMKSTKVLGIKRHKSHILVGLVHMNDMKSSNLWHAKRGQEKSRHFLGRC